MFHAVLYKEVLDLLARAEAEPVPPSTSWHTVVGGASQVGCLLSLLHSFWLHANMGLLLHLPRSVVPPLATPTLQGRLAFLVGNRSVKVLC